LTGKVKTYLDISYLLRKKKELEDQKYAIAASGDKKL